MGLLLKIIKLDKNIEVTKKIGFVQMISQM